MSQDNVELVRRALHALSEGGVEAALALHLYTEDLLVYPTSEWPDAGVYRGYDGFRMLYHAWAGNFDELKLELRESREVGDRVVSLFEFTGRLKDSGIPICEAWGVVNSFRDGYISEVRLFRSHRQALATVGLAEEA